MMPVMPLLTKCMEVSTTFGRWLRMAPLTVSVSRFCFGFFLFFLLTLDRNRWVPLV